MILGTIVRAVLGSRNERVIKRTSKQVQKINALEPEMQKLTDEELKNKKDEFKVRLEKGEKLNDLLVEAFAVVREVSVRTIGLRHFDVQCIGGMVLNGGNIAEMRTGEGKTLVATMPVYLRSITGRGVHLVTVNDYLAKRDAEWMRPVYESLGLSVGINLPDMSPEDKRVAYNCDITYGTNNEFGFDYLRDNMALEVADKVQRELHFAIVDEVDSILIDEARTPLIISGPSEGSADDYEKVNVLVPKLVKREKEDGPGDFYLDEKQKQAYLTEAGHETIERLMFEAGLIGEGETLYDPKNITFMHYMNALLRAHHLYQRDVDYVVNAAREVVIVDEHTGRTMPGRRWSEGLHQAVEAKEAVPIQNENQTLASITFQNYFRLYSCLSGMTGTADTEAYEFQQIYSLEVVVIPTNKKIQRKDSPDKIYLTQHGKYNSLIGEIKQRSENKQPVLVGTASIETSEYLSSLLKKANVKHQVLNAKYHEKEAHIIEQAGCPGTVTIATNMAGRGTDIVLGGNLEAELSKLQNPTDEQVKAVREDWQQRHETVIKAGGLHILGSERHESRRIDNQLRGRSGRQGDPGSSSFYLSLEDHLLRIFASPKLGGMMRRLGMKEDEAIEHRIISKAIENAQRKVESFHFDMRKQLLEYDDVANDQRKVVYERRDELLEADEISETIEAIKEDVVETTVDTYIPAESLEEQWDVKGLQEILATDFNLHIELEKMLSEDEQLAEEGVREKITEMFDQNLKEKAELIGEEQMRDFEKAVMLQTLDGHWKDHLAAVDHLRQGIHLRGYAQKDPKQEYKREAFNLFVSMLDNMKYEVLQMLINAKIETQDVAAINEARRTQQANQSFQYHFNDVDALLEPDAEQEAGLSSEGEVKPLPFIRPEQKVGRNDPCPCGSGKKYKQCHGKLS